MLCGSVFRADLVFGYGLVFCLSLVLCWAYRGWFRLVVCLFCWGYRRWLCACGVTVYIVRCGLTIDGGSTVDLLIFLFVLIFIYVYK